MTQAKKTRYDTLVIRDTKQKTFPRTSNGDEVVCCAQGHIPAYNDAIEDFMFGMERGEYQFVDNDSLIAEVRAVMTKARRQREHGYDE
jgi:hypothetical protein